MCWVRVGYVSGAWVSVGCRGLVGYVLGACRVRVGYVWSICWAHVRYVLGACGVRVGRTLGSCWVCVGRMSGMCRACGGYMSGACRAHVACAHRVARLFRRWSPSPRPPRRTSGTGRPPGCPLWNWRSPRDGATPTPRATGSRGTTSSTTTRTATRWPSWTPARWTAPPRPWPSTPTRPPSTARCCPGARSRRLPSPSRRRPCPCRPTRPCPRRRACPCGCTCSAWPPPWGWASAWIEWRCARAAPRRSGRCSPLHCLSAPSVGERGRYPTLLQGAQSTRSHCIPDGKCPPNWHL